MQCQTFSPKLLNRTSAPLTALLLASTALVGFTSARAQELPTGGSVASGGVTISNLSASQLNIKQSTNSAIVNWQSFSIGSGATVNIDQPTSTSTMLNRVTGGTKSTIAGQLNANGQVFLVNPNGIAISKTGKVSAAGFVGSSLDISDDDFKAGKLKFQGKGASAAVSNEGAISIGRGGYAALIGGSVDNAGTISVPLGKVGLGSGEKATLDLSGDGFLQVSVPTQAGGSNALVSNSGTISADGGTVELKAAAVRDAARQAVNMSGVIEARTVSGQSGAIVLGGDQGDVEISGKLDTSAASSGKGGKITVTGRKLKLKGATVDASGKSGGGTIKIGGDKQGSGTLQRAATTEVDAATTINASATGNGNGGTVIVWSDEVTGFQGTILARGGDSGGDGGFSEVSSHDVLDFDGNVDLSARFGDTGYLLLDPYNLTISTTGSPTVPGSGPNFSPTQTSTLRVSTLVNALNSANVVVSTGTSGSQAGDITVASAVQWSSGNSLTLSAYRNIAVNAGLTSTGGGAINLRADSSGTGTGTVSFASSAIKASTSGVVSIYYNPASNPAGSGINTTSYTSSSDYSGNIAGGATLNAAMLVNTLNDLRNINNNQDGNYALGRSIDASGTTFTSAPVGTLSGSFDGLGNTISNLTITSGDNAIGLFGTIAGGATVRNLNLANVAVTGTGNANFAGGLAGSNQGSVSGATVSGTVKITGDSYRYAGGLVGYNDGAISGAISTASVSAGYYSHAGGLAGGLTGSITGSSASGTVTVGAQGSGGGLVGEANQGSSIMSSFATGTVTGGSPSQVGGLAGLLNGGSITASYSSSVVNAGNGSSAGGLVGATRNGASINMSYATGAVTVGNGYLGGLVGATLSAGDTITNSYATGKLTGLYLGGLVGSNYGSISSSYFDIDTTGASAGVGYSQTTTGGTGLHTSDFMTASNFTGWTFGTTAGGPGWVIVDVDSSLNNAGGAAGGTRPMLLSEYSTTITNAHQLQLMALNLNGKYTLGNNIDASTTAGGQGVWGAGGFVPIGSAIATSSAIPTNANLPMGTSNERAFTGTFDGKGFSVSNLYINRPTTDFVGLIGFATAATIQNVTLNGGSVTGRDHVGALLGGDRGFDSNYNFIATYLTNLSASTAVSGRDFVGGLAGSIEAGWVTTVSASGTVSGRDYVGGLGGYISSNSGFVQNDSSVSAIAASATGAVSGRNNVGGLFGYFYSGFYGTSFATGNVTATGDNVGGLIGQGMGGVSSNSTDNLYATGSVTGNNYVGGLIGFATSFTLTRSYATGAVTGNTAVGGLVGSNDSGSLIDLSFATGVVRGVDQVGGLAGRNLSVIGVASTTGTYATGAVYGTSNVGGLVGYNGFVNMGSYSLNGRIQSSYSIGAVNGTTNVGGLVGYNGTDPSGNYAPTIKNSYWDTETAGASLAGVGGGVTTGANAGATGKTTAQLMAALQTPFSSTTWGIVANTSLPYFKWLYASTPQVVTGTAYSDRGTTPLAGVATNILVNGTITPASAVGSTGANGYYYFLLPNGTIASGGSQVLVTSSGPSAGATFQQNATGSLNGLSIYGGYLKQQGAASTLSALSAARATAIGANAAASSLIGGLANMEIDPSGSTFSIDQAISVPGTLVFSSTGTVNQTASISANGLLLLGSGGNYALNNAGNSIGTVAASTGTVSVADSSDLTIGTVAGTSGVTATGAVTLQTAGKLTIAAAAKVTAGANSNAVLAAGGAFVNNRGSDAVSVSGTGRWLVYASGPTGNTFGNLDSGNTAIWNTAAGGAVSATGNRYVFAYQPTLTFASNNTSMVYGDAMPTLTYSVSGYQAGVANAYLGDNATTAFTGAPALYTPSTLALQPLGAGTYTITIDAANVAARNGYALAFNSTGLISVAKRMVTVTANSGQGKTYGDADPSSLGYGYTSLGNGVALVGALDRASGEDVGGYAIGQGTLTNGNNSNYDITFVGGTSFNIGKRAVTVTATSGQGKTYGDADPSSLGYSYTSLGSGVALVGALDRAGGEDVGGYAIGQGTLTNGNNSNYDITFDSSTFSIGKRAVTVTATAGQGKTYGNADPSSYGYSYTSLGSGVALVGVLDRASGEDVGSYAIGQGTLTNASNSNYDITFDSSTFAIGKRAVTVTATAGQGKTYGDADPTSYGYSYTSLGSGTALVGVLDRAAGENVGGYAIGRGTLTDAANANYDITFDSSTFSIGKRAVTVTATAGQGKTYGDADPSSYGYTTSGLGNGIALVGALDRASGEDVGGYAIGQGSLTNGNNSNYDITFVGGTSFNIGKRAVTVTATAGQGKTYGNADPSSYGYTTSGLGNGVALVGALDRASGEDVGGYAIGQGTLTNASNSNYDITFDSSTFSIGKRAVTVTATAGQGKTYGNADPTSYGYSYTSLGSGVALVGVLDRASGEDVGGYAIGQGTLTNASNSNYDITFDSSTFAIGKRAVTVTATAGQGKTYGDADPSSYGYSYTSLGSGTALVGVLDRAAGENVGGYAIGRGTLTDAANANYDITFDSSTFSIGKRAVTVTATSGQGKAYGDADPSSYGYTTSGLGNGVALVGALDRASGEDVGGYAISQGTLTNTNNSNYDITFVDGTSFTIGKRAVTVTATAGQGKVYGNADPSSYGYTYSDLGSGVALFGALDRAAGENAGNYAIGQGTLTNANNSNYDITFASADFTVGKRAITVVADAQSRAQGMPNPALTYTIGGLGLVGADTLTGALSTAATPASVPGSYAIEQGSLAASANYELTYVGADLTVGPPNTVPATDAASIVAYNAGIRGAGMPLPVRFTGEPADGDSQTLFEDPRLGGFAFCQGVAETAAVCTATSVQ